MHSERLPALRLANQPDMPLRLDPNMRSGSPTTRSSTLMTSAPWDASRCEPPGAAMKVAISTTRMPSSGPGPFESCICDGVCAWV